MQGVKIQRSPRPALMNWITPVLIVKDISDSMDFYERAFGFEKGQTIADADGKLVEGSMKYKGAVVIMLEKECAFGNECKSPASSGIPSPVTLYVYCDNVDEFYTHAQKSGAKIFSRPADMFWGDRIAQFDDPDGYRWTFATNVADYDPASAPA